MANKGCCVEWEQELILYLDNELPEQGCSRVKKHLRQCKYCAALYHEMERETQLIGGRLRHLADAGMPDLSFTNLVMDSLPSSTVMTIRGRSVEWGRRIRSILSGPARVHLAVAASLLICIAGIFATTLLNPDPRDITIEVKRNQDLQEYALLESILISHPEGEFFEFKDGSIVYAPQGTLFYIGAYQQGADQNNVGSDRQIHLLQGELFLEVHPAKEGFNVVCANSKTTVFGTKFFVGYNPDRKCTSVAVLEGQVFVEKVSKNNLRGSTVLHEKQMTQVIQREGHTALHSPVSIMRVDPSILTRLIQFRDALGNRQARGIMPKPGVTIMDGVEIETE
ncbi:MAG: FecR domain-containing protein [bacterium]|jgi:hypothetical protein|nr:FecR domain-containing protein [bacterium]